MFEYRELAETAAELITEFGADIKLRRDEGAEYDVDTATVEGAERVWSGKAIRIENEITDDDGGKRVTRVRLLLGTAGIDQPTTGDRLSFDGDSFVVTTSEPMKTATVAVAYDVHAQK